ncbi:retinol dehydrogenase 13-like [Penaeus indicus]|uniref:retinol dehydrogenase 13-like n=1 Tax=Penaeus indicus TaxID=29960 RepID=UPI00300C3850
MCAWVLAVGISLFLCLGVVYLVYLRHVNKGTRNFWPATVKLDGKTAVITTNGSDIGVEAARQMAARGARIVLACSDQRKVNEAMVDTVSSSHVPQVTWRHLDTSSLASVNDFVDAFVRREERIDILVMAACTGGAVTRELTADGLEVTMATNHFGHFLLVNRLIGLLRKHKSSRVIVLAASAHYMLSTITPKNLNFERAKYGGLRAFAQSMLCNILMSNCLADATAHTGMTVNSFCPGMVLSLPYIRGSNFLARLYYILLQFVTRSISGRLSKMSGLASKSLVQRGGSETSTTVEKKMRNCCPLVHSDHFDGVTSIVLMLPLSHASDAHSVVILPNALLV